MKMNIENDLKRKMRDNLRRLRDIGTYRGRRHALVGFPWEKLVWGRRGGETLWANDGGIVGTAVQRAEHEESDPDGEEVEPCRAPGVDWRRHHRTGYSRCGEEKGEEGGKCIISRISTPAFFDFLLLRTDKPDCMYRDDDDL